MTVKLVAKGWTGFAAGCALVLGLLAAPSLAQQITPGQVQQMLGNQPSTDTSGRLQTNALSNGINQQNQNQAMPGLIIEPSAPTTAEALPTTQLETLMSQRAGASLQLFGYNEVGVGRAVLLPQQGGVQESYVLGPGDEILVSLRGQETSENRVMVDRSGRATMSRLAPIAAAGRTFGEFSRELQAAVGRAYVATQAYVSLGAVRQIRVQVGGEVNSPGVRNLNGLSSPLDAIFVSNGIKKSGSLRNVQIVRNGRRIRIDFYSILRGVGSPQLPLLADGDQLIVPTIGPVVAVAGAVRAPAIYELRTDRPEITAAQLVLLAGGYAVRGRYNLSRVQLMPDGRTQLSELTQDSAIVRDGDALVVRSAAEQTTNRVSLVGGGSGFTGSYAVQTTKLSEMLKTPGAMGDDPYPIFAIISRRDPVSYLRDLIAVTPAAVLQGRQDFNLQSDDIVQLLDRKTAAGMIADVSAYGDQKSQQEEALRNPQTVAEGQGGPFGGGNDNGNGNNAGAGSSGRGTSQNGQSANGNAGFNDAAGAAGSRATGSGAAGSRAMMQSSGMPSALRAGPAQVGDAERQSASVSLESVTPVATALRVDPVILINFLRDHVVTVSGAIRGPGTYLVGPGLDMATLVKAAGGTSGWSEVSGVEQVSTIVDSATGQSRTIIGTININDAQMASTLVRPRDQYRFPEIQTTLASGTVTLQGEVRHPGVYPVKRGEHLSEVLVRAGGLTNVAYPYGSIFLRKSLAERERQGFQREAKDMESQLILALSRTGSTAGQSAITPDAFNGIQTLIDDMRNQKGLGRITVVADPAVLATHPASDPLLEPGDVLFVPQRPSTVTVLGEVMNTASVLAQPTMSVRDYINRAGGYTRFADESLTFVILPDGTARRFGDSSWFGIGGDGGAIPPGSVIVVPRDISPFDFKGLLLETTTILGQMAITAASLAILAKQ